MFCPNPITFKNCKKVQYFGSPQNTNLKPNVCVAARYNFLGGNSPSVYSAYIGKGHATW